MYMYPSIGENIFSLVFTWLRKLKNMANSEEPVVCVGFDDVGHSDGLRDRKKTDAQSNLKIVPEEEETDGLVYGITDMPPWHVTAFYSVQIILSNIFGPLAVAYYLQDTLCASGNTLVFSEMFSTSVFMCGVCTFLQCTFGSRLPIFQGSSHSYLPPIIAMMTTDKWKCPEEEALNSTLSLNTSHVMTQMPEGEDEVPAWMVRVQEVSGALIAASAIQVIIGITGLMGFMMAYIGPLTIVPTVAMVGFSLIDSLNRSAQYQWGIFILTMALMIVFSLFLGRIQVPLPSWRPGKGCHSVKYPVFKFYPQIFAVCIVWLFCLVLTVTNVFPNDKSLPSYRARTDAKLYVVGQAKWFFFPYPGRWGWPRLGPGVFVGMLAATISSIVESVGDYYATARVSRVPPPPRHAVNRGVAMEGLGSMVSGLVGACHATTSYSRAIGFISLNRVGSRFIWQVTSALLIAFGVFGKFGAVLCIVPDPIIAGMNTVGLGLVVMVALSNLTYVDMDSSRNQVILAASFMLALMAPAYLKQNPGVIHTGSDIADQVLTVFLSTSTFIGGVVGFILDNLVPGTRKERGLVDFDKMQSSKDISPEIMEKIAKVYHIPGLDRCLSKSPIFTYIPCLQSYQERHFCSCGRKAKDAQQQTNNQVTNDLKHDNSEVISVV